ncbi:hypothetical protein [Antarcticirhabdus aurantiaca]|uniref:Uncharacterized protein n=1 Tax=Antarcticirhabdus aurantiaca TaxID=2606717 RepID=A0ACD4NJ05_9HYPH|nr:hypothetical protein OXU80_17790 [Jeongeuplla avenae]
MIDVDLVRSVREWMASVAGESWSNDLPKLPRKAGETWLDERRRALDTPEVGASRFEGVLPDGGRWTCRFAYRGRFRDETLVDVCGADGTASWKIFGFQTALEGDRTRRRGWERSFTSASVSGRGMVVHVLDQPEMHAFDEVESRPGIDVRAWRHIAGEIGRMAIDRLGEEILTHLLQGERGSMRYRLEDWLREADALVRDDAQVASVEETYAEILSRLPDKVTRKLEAMDMAAIAAPTQHAVDSALGVLLLGPMRKAQGLVVRPTRRRSGFRQAGELVEGHRETAILRDGTIHDARFRGCSQQEGERILGETAVRLVGAKSWVFDREDLAGVADVLVSARSAASETRKRYEKAAASVSDGLEALCRARDAYVAGVSDPCPVLCEVPEPPNDLDCASSSVEIVEKDSPARTLLW